MRLSFRRVLSPALLILTSLGILGLTSGGLHAKEKYQVQEVPEYTLADGASATQTIGDVTVQVTTLNQDGYLFPEIFSFGETDKAALEGKGFKFSNVQLWFPPDSTGKQWINVLGNPSGKPNLLAYKVKITNKTKHIIRFKEMQIYLAAPGSEEPISPTEDHSVFTQWIYDQEKTFEKTRKKGILSFPYPVGLAASIFDLRFPDWNRANILYKQVLPKFSVSGLLIFPATDDLGDVTLTFYEVATKTNPAGAITERSSFEFPFKLVTRKLWYDSKTTKRWIYGDPPGK